MVGVHVYSCVLCCVSRCIHYIGVRKCIIGSTIAIKII